MDDSIDDEAQAAMSAWARVLIGIAGTGLLIAGLLAVFVKDTNVAGVPLLIVAGAAFVYVSLTGQQLIQVNKDGVVFGRVKRLEKVLREATADPDLPFQSKERLADIAEDNGIRVARPSDAELEQQVLQMLERISLTSKFTIGAPPGGADLGVDFALTNESGQTVGVEVKRRMQFRHFAEVIRRLRTTRWDYKLLIVDGGIPEELAAPYRAEGIWIIRWDPDGDDRVTDVFREMGFVDR
ncbi:hypothetical protein [Curtobacterium sp. 458]|uniref:hypothetical protein n=1 Tax=Curtobacterium sp. 458 TaxID=3050069 RepID=UPI0025B2EAC2|nr:hypothetical protein [Curtobacterium sp. 458]WJY00837.1 hypothetical protein QPJ90_03850 [Curtobacterium sp. 458]